MNENRQSYIAASGESAMAAKAQKETGMVVHWLSRTISSVADGIRHKGVTMPLRKIQLLLAKEAALILLYSILCGSAQAVVNVYLGSNVPSSMQADFIAATTTQYQTTLVPSTYFPGTYTLTILGKNPPPQCGGVVVLPCNLDQDVASIVAVTTQSYVYGFASGMNYQQHQDSIITEQFEVQCGTRSYFTTSTATWNSQTCLTALSDVDATIFQQSLSTPTVIPPPGF